MRTIRFLCSFVLLSVVWYASVGAAWAQTVPTEDTLKRKQLPALTIDEMKSEFIGNTLVHKSLKSGAKFPIYFDKGGTRTMLFKEKKHTTSWRFTGRHLCIVSVRDSNEFCADYYRDEDVYRWCDPREAGLCQWEITIEQGNSRGL